MTASRFWPFRSTAERPEPATIILQGALPKGRTPMTCLGAHLPLSGRPIVGRAGVSAWRQVSAGGASR